jgi:hypothetical protein
VAIEVTTGVRAQPTTAVVRTRAQMVVVRSELIMVRLLVGSWCRYCVGGADAEVRAHDASF